jgi:UDP-N-acetylmuramate--alanine ligase
VNTAAPYYFLGIGGIGMSALARYFNQMGHLVFGYDKTPSELTDKLQSEGITITFEDAVSSLPQEIIEKKGDAQIVYTPAIPKDHVQYNWLLANGFMAKKRSVVLGEISTNTFNIAVAGTHGKTTTSCMIAHLLNTAGIPFSAFLGGVSADLGSNYFNSGKTKEGIQITVTEADEFDRSFLTLSPDISIITSTDADHLDIYGRAEEVKKSFYDFAHRLEKDGTLYHAFGLHDDLPKDINRISYGIDKGSIHAEQVRFENGKFLFDLYIDNTVFRYVNLAVPGWHNVENAVVAAAVAHQLGASEDDIKKGLSTFKGVKRRFEYIKNDEQGIFIDDYAHHPTELNAIISSVKRMYPDKKITGIFQPHLYSRTRDFVDGFAASLDLLDEAILMPIYPARELPIAGVESDMILEKMQNKHAIVCGREGLIARLSQSKVEVLLTLGAGDIDREIGKLKIWMNEANK